MKGKKALAGLARRRKFFDEDLKGNGADRVEVRFPEATYTYHRPGSQNPRKGYTKAGR